MTAAGPERPPAAAASAVPRGAAGIAFALLAAGVAAGICYAVYGRHAAVTTLAILAPVGVLTVLALEALLARRAQLGGMRRQLLVVGAIVAIQLMIAASLFAELMTVSAQDALFMAVVAAYAGLIGAWAARAIGRRMLRDIDELRRGLGEIGAGERDVHILTEGHDELALVATDIAAMAGRLAAEERAGAVADHARRDLVAAVSHDLRTPITSLRLLAEALDDNLVDAGTRREYVKRIGVQVRALGSLIDDLFELSRLEAGDIRWTIEKVPLDALVHETIDAMRPQADARSISVQAELSPGLAAARANPEQLQRVLFNLVQNAIRHTPADGSVTIRAEPAPDRVEIEVADTGEGIAPAEREHIFDAFVQGASRAARGDPGAGLGLAISRAIVEAHGGRIWLEDAQVGTRVRFSLPWLAPAPVGQGY